MPLTIPFTFAVTIPAGTAKTAPLVTVTRFASNIVERVEWLFPVGCNGQVGIQIGSRSVPIIPISSTQWLIRSGDSASLGVSGMPNTGDWSVIGYNLGAFDHTVQVSFVARRIESAQRSVMIVTDMSSILSYGES